MGYVLPTNELTRVITGAIITGEINPGGGVIVGKKGQSLQSITFQASEDCIVKVYAGGLHKKTISEEVMDRLVGRTSKLLIAQFSINAREGLMGYLTGPLPITITNDHGKLKYFAEVVK